jgi:hypothetical protein
MWGKPPAKSSRSRQAQYYRIGLQEKEESRMRASMLTLTATSASGLGTVFGAKKLKALLISGNKEIKALITSLQKACSMPL